MDNREWLLKRISIIDAMKLAFESAPMLFVNEDYLIEWSTPEVNKLFGYVTGELDGKELSILIPPDKRDRHKGFFRMFFDNPVDRNMGTEIAQTVFSGYKKDTAIIRVSISLRAKAVDGKKVICAMIFPVIEIK